MQQEKLSRISELTRIARERELTPIEAEERAALRAQYLALVRSNFRSTMEQTWVMDADGNQSRLSEQYTKGKKK